MKEMTINLKIESYKFGLWIVAVMACAVLVALLLSVCCGEPLDAITKAILSGLFALSILALLVMQVYYLVVAKDVLRLALQLKIESEKSQKDVSTGGDDKEGNLADEGKSNVESSVRVDLIVKS